MPIYPIWQADAFVGPGLTGNPAAMVVIDDRPGTAWPDDTLLQAIAVENNLSETAYLRPHEGAAADWDLRWFTPAAEIDLCGHATLASAWLVLTHLTPDAGRVRFQTVKSGVLTVARDGTELEMDFPATPPAPIEPEAGLAEALGGGAPEAVLAGGPMVVVVYAAAETVRSLRPDMAGLARLEKSKIIVTAPGDGDGYDIVSRFFAPAWGVGEDPVTGSAHCVLLPYWAQRLGKDTLRCHQASARGGLLVCQANGGRVSLRGTVKPYLDGRIFV